MHQTNALSRLQCIDHNGKTTLEHPRESNRHAETFQKLTMHRRLQSAVSLHQAADNSPSLARLADLVRESNNRLKAIETLIPATLRPAVKAGPVDSDNWCLLVNGNAASAKVRQLIPLIQSSLLRQGWKVKSIRLKIFIAKNK